MKHLLPFLFFLLPALLGAQVDLNQPWKFITGDNPAYIDPAFDDKAWASISVEKNWEDQGYAGYNGYAWYRFHFRLPASLKSAFSLKNAFRIQLGKIDDADAAYLNGRKIGQTGAFPDDLKGYRTEWDRNRLYLAVFPENDAPVRWDADNVLAVRVYDGDGPGGFFGSSARTFAPADITDFVALSATSELHGDTTRVVFSLHNQFFHPVEGTVAVQLENSQWKKPQSKIDTAVQLAIGEAQSFAVEQAVNDRTLARLNFTEKQTGKAMAMTRELYYLLTPPESPKPRINNAEAYGARPGAPVLFTIAATGQRPMLFSAKGLPAGLKLDDRTGIITGTVHQRGITSVTVEASNSLGTASKVVNFVIGDNICLTPPLGWNSWNCWGLSVSDERVRASANAMISSGLANHGWTYMNIDDGWEAGRDPQSGAILCNEKFPDMKALCAYLHGLGLKTGIYSSPGTKTCGGYTGTWQHEEQDARTWAGWGIDYLKYDWCSYGQIAPQKPELPDLQKPYKVMRAALDKTGRDIVYSLCQYGMGDVWKWGAEVGGNLWRTTGDITDTWESLSSIGFDQAKASPHARPGRWNDPDMLIVGQVGWGDQLHLTRLSPSEQYTHISLWAMLSAPLLIGCDLARMDPFTYNLLANDEVLAIDQDIAGKQAARRIDRDGYQVWVKELADGSSAIAVFNLKEDDRNISVNWAELGVTGYKKLRDVWRQRNLGKAGKMFSARVNGHGVALLRLSQ